MRRRIATAPSTLRVPGGLPGSRARAAVLVGTLAWGLLACSATGSDRPRSAADRASPAAGPLATADPGGSRSSPSVDPSRSGSAPTVTIAFGGDVHFEGVDRVRLAANPATAVGPVAGLLRRADVAMVNLETAVTTRGTPAAKRFVFRAPPTAFVALRSAGVDVVTQANNHGMDYGLIGLRDSLAEAKAAGFPVVGIGADSETAYAPWVTTVRGERIAVLGATQVLDANLISAWTAGPGKPGLASAKNAPRLLAAIRAARASADLVVVYLHWGTEMHSCPNAAQRTLAKAIADAGADVIVGSHAHVLLGAGRLGSSYVSYGLGNFVFYARSGPTLDSGVLTLTLVGRTVRSARFTPARISGGVPIPLTGGPAVAAERAWQRLRNCTGLESVP